jgi:hypothetical protein
MRCAVFLMLCSPLAQAALHGIVTDASTGEPIPDANVILISASGIRLEGISDASGRYWIPATPKGHFDVSASKPGYIDMRPLNFVSTLGMPIDVGDYDETRDFSLVRPCYISGHITDPSGNPLRSAVVVRGTQDFPNTRSLFTSSYFASTPRTKMATMLVTSRFCLADTSSQ